MLSVKKSIELLDAYEIVVSFDFQSIETSTKNAVAGKKVTNKLNHVYFTKWGNSDYDVWVSYSLICGVRKGNESFNHDVYCDEEIEELTEAINRVVPEIIEKYE